MTAQKRIWESEDLPLFSGTPVRVDPPKAASDTTHRQRLLGGAECGLCFDTGIIMDGHEPKFCWCDAGLQAWDQAHQEGDV